MSTATTVDRAGISKASETTESLGVNWRRLGMIAFSILGVYALYRVYMQNFSYNVGLDSFEPEFQTYWMNLLYAQIAFFAVSGAGILGYLWFTRSSAEELANISPTEELSRYFGMLGWLFTFGMMAGVMGALGTESDAAWHQVVIRDSDFTPTHIELFYFCIPALIISAMGLFLYMRTRIPAHSRKFFVPLMIGISGPALILPLFGYNEWGHTFFYAEELFAAPVHWGFAIMGVAFLALGGILTQIVGRMSDLMEQVAAEQK